MDHKKRNASGHISGRNDRKQKNNKPVTTTSILDSIVDSFKKIIHISDYPNDNEERTNVFNKENSKHLPKFKKLFTNPIFKDVDINESENNTSIYFQYLKAIDDKVREIHRKYRKVDIENDQAELWMLELNENNEIVITTAVECKRTHNYLWIPCCFLYGMKKLNPVLYNIWINFFVLIDNVFNISHWHDLIDCNSYTGRTHEYINTLNDEREEEIREAIDKNLENVIDIVSELYDSLIEFKSSVLAYKEGQPAHEIIQDYLATIKNFNSGFKIQDHINAYPKNKDKESLALFNKWVPQLMNLLDNDNKKLLDDYAICTNKDGGVTWHECFRYMWSLSDTMFEIYEDDFSNFANEVGIEDAYITINIDSKNVSFISNPVVDVMPVLFHEIFVIVNNKLNRYEKKYEQVMKRKINQFKKKENEKAKRSIESINR